MGAEGRARFLAVDGFPKLRAHACHMPLRPAPLVLPIPRAPGLGWQAQIPLERGVRETVAWYIANQGKQDLRL